jgi:hypothetical protein
MLGNSILVFSTSPDRGDAIVAAAQPGRQVVFRG